jgi:hypothetical protein
MLRCLIIGNMPYLCKIILWEFGVDFMRFFCFESPYRDIEAERGVNGEKGRISGVDDRERARLSPAKRSKRI